MAKIIYLSDETHKRLKLLATSSNMTLSRFTEELIVEAIKSKGTVSGIDPFISQEWDDPWKNDLPEEDIFPKPRVKS